MTDFESRFAALHQRFLERTEGERRLLVDKPDREAMEKVAHQLSGSAGMFGYHELSEAAAALEDALRGAGSDEEVERLRAALTAAIEAVQAR